MRTGKKGKVDNMKTQTKTDIFVKITLGTALLSASTLMLCTAQFIALYGVELFELIP